MPLAVDRHAQVLRRSRSRSRAAAAEALSSALRSSVPLKSGLPALDLRAAPRRTTRRRTRADRRRRCGAVRLPSPLGDRRAGGGRATERARSGRRTSTRRSRARSRWRSPPSASTTHARLAPLPAPRRGARRVGGARRARTASRPRRRCSASCTRRRRAARRGRVVGVRAQEALDVRVRGEAVELLLLERRRYLARTFVRLLDLGEVEALPRPGLAQAGADLEHRGRIVVAEAPRAARSFRPESAGAGRRRARCSARQREADARAMPRIRPSAPPSRRRGGRARARSAAARDRASSERGDAEHDAERDREAGTRQRVRAE